MGGRLCPKLLRVDKFDLILSYRVVDRVLHERTAIRDAPQTFEVRFVFGEEKGVGVFAMEFVAAKHIMAGFDHRRRAFTQNWFANVTAPAPNIAKPNRRQKMQDRWLWSVVGRRCANQNILWGSFGISDLDVEVVLLRQGIGVPELEFGLHS